LTKEQKQEWSAKPACTCDIGEPDAVNLPGKYLLATKVRVYVLLCFGVILLFSVLKIRLF